MISGVCVDEETVDRSSPVGYRLSSIAFHSLSGEPVAAADSSTALTDVLTNKDNSVCPDGCFRPVGLARDGQGRLWMTSDSTGEIYVLELTGKSGDGMFVQPEGGGEHNVAAGLWAGGPMMLGWGVAGVIGVWLAV
jgi:hypothetical protein